MSKLEELNELKKIYETIKESISPEIKQTLEEKLEKMEEEVHILNIRSEYDNIITLLDELVLYDMESLETLTWHHYTKTSKITKINEGQLNELLETYQNTTISPQIKMEINGGIDSKLLTKIKLLTICLENMLQAPSAIIETSLYEINPDFLEIIKRLLQKNKKKQKCKK